MLEGSEFNIRFRTNALCYNLHYFGQGLIRFKGDICEIEGERLQNRPGCLRSCFGFCLGAAFDFACCCIGNWLLAAITLFTIKPLIWMFGKVTQTTPVRPVTTRPIRVQGCVVRFAAKIPDQRRHIGFCLEADTEGLAQVIADRLEALVPGM